MTSMTTVIDETTSGDDLTLVAPVPGPPHAPDPASPEEMGPVRAVNAWKKAQSALTVDASDSAEINIFHQLTQTNL